MNNRHLIILIVLFLATVAGVWAYKEYNRQRVSTEQLLPAHTVSASELLIEFKENELLATAKYSGRNLIISVHGNLKEFAKSQDGVITLMMGDSSSLSSVQCTMDDISNDRLGKLETGTSIRIKGVFNGYSADDTGILGSDLKMNHCIIEK